MRHVALKLVILFIVTHKDDSSDCFTILVLLLVGGLLMSLATNLASAFSWFHFGNWDWF